MKFALAIITLSFLTYGCSGGGRTRVGAPWCDKDRKSVSFEVAGAKRKMDLSKTTDIEMPEGTYELTGIELYVNDKGNGVRLHVTAKVVDGQTSPDDTSLECVGTYRNDALELGNLPYTYELDAFSKIIASGTGAAQKTVLGGGQISIDIRDRGPGKSQLETTFVKDDSKTVQKSLKNTYEGFAEKTQFLFELTDSFEMQNRLKVSDDVTVESRQIWKKKVD